MARTHLATYDHPVSDVQDTLDTIAGLAVHRCGHCDEPLTPRGPSPDFCDDVCQQRWTKRKAEVAELIGYREPYDLPEHQANQVELLSPEVIPPPETGQGWPLCACPACQHHEERLATFEHVAVYGPSGVGLFQVQAPDPRYYQEGVPRHISDPDGATWWALGPPVNGRQQWRPIRGPR
jgi:hypothetical protein